jgi:hypothetical protein
VRKASSKGSYGLAKPRTARAMSFTAKAPGRAGGRLGQSLKPIPPPVGLLDRNVNRPRTWPKSLRRSAHQTLGLSKPFCRDQRCGR